MDHVIDQEKKQVFFFLIPAYLLLEAPLMIRAVLHEFNVITMKEGLKVVDIQGFPKKTPVMISKVK